MSALFVGGHPAMDFLNTSFAPQGESVEVIGDGRSFMAWLVEAGLLESPRASALKRRLDAATLDTVATEARRLRTWAAGWITRWRDAPGESYRTELRRLNDLLHRGASYSEVVATDEGFRIERRREIDTADGLLALIAEQVAALVAHEEPGLVKRCTGNECTLWFLDRTKGHRRMFCSASACGNRAKVAAFRDRRRARARP